MKRDSFPITEYVIGMEKFTANLATCSSHISHTFLSHLDDSFLLRLLLGLASDLSLLDGSQEKSLNLHPRNHRFMTKKTFMCRYTPLILLLCCYIVMLHYEDGGDGGTLDSRLCEIKIMNREKTSDDD